MFNTEGIITAMVTPMTENEKIDKNKLRKLVNRNVEKNVDGIFCLSTNGEFFSLSKDEKILITETVVDECNGRLPVIAGTGGITTQEVIDLTKKVQEIGVDAVSIITPYFISPTQEELYKHYKMIAESVTLPIILYNIPSKTGVSLHYKTVAKLAKINNIIGIKDSSGDFDNTLRYLEETDEDFMVYSGNDSLVLWTLQAGGNGSVSGMANIFPELMNSIFNLWQNGEFEEAKKQQDKIRPIRNTLKLATFPSIVKIAMELTGVSVGSARSPVTFPDKKVIEKVKNVLKYYDF